MEAEYDQKVGRIRQWLHSSALRRAHGRLTCLAFWCVIVLSVDY